MVATGLRLSTLIETPENGRKDLDCGTIADEVPVEGQKPTRPAEDFVAVAQAETNVTHGLLGAASVGASDTADSDSD